MCICRTVKMTYLFMYDCCGPSTIFQQMITYSLKVSTILRKNRVLEENTVILAHGYGLRAF